MTRELQLPAMILCWTCLLGLATSFGSITTTGFSVSGQLPQTSTTAWGEGRRLPQAPPFCNHNNQRLFAKSSPDDKGKDDHDAQEDDATITSLSTTSRKKNNRGVPTFLRNLWRGVTIPFPALRRVVAQPTADDDSSRVLGIGLSVREGLLALGAYLVLGVLGYSVVFEKWSIVDALYVSLTICTTVGYGDLCPTTTASKLFTCLYGLGGVACLGTAVATVGGKFVQAEADALQEARAKSRTQLLRLFDGMPQVLEHHRGESRERQLEELRVARTKFRERLAEPMLHRVGVVTQAILKALPSLWIILGGGALMGVLSGGPGEPWSLWDSIYYGIITSSTIGLGDISPQTPTQRVFAIFYLPLSVAAAGEILGSIASALLQRRQRKVYAEQLEKDLTIEHLRAMDTDQNGRISREEYVHFMLLEMGRISSSELDELHTQFEQLDVTRSGYLDNADLALMAELRGAKVENNTSSSS